MATKHAITISFNENCGSERARFLFGRIWNRACKRTGRKFARPRGLGAVDRGVKEKTHIHIIAELDHLKDWFLQCLQESCQHFNERFESWSKVIPDDQVIPYLRYIESKRIAKTAIVW